MKGKMKNAMIGAIVGDMENGVSRADAIRKLLHQRDGGF